MASVQEVDAASPVAAGDDAAAAAAAAIDSSDSSDSDDYDSDSDDDDDEESVLSRVHASVVSSKAYSVTATAMSTAGRWGAWLAVKGGKMAWVTTTTSLVLVVPLIFALESNQMQQEMLQQQAQQAAQMQGAPGAVGGVPAAGGVVPLPGLVPQ